MLDLVGTPIVGFLTHRLKYHLGTVSSKDCCEPETNFVNTMKIVMLNRVHINIVNCDIITR